MLKTQPALQRPESGIDYIFFTHIDHICGRKGKRHTYVCICKNRSLQGLTLLRLILKQ